MLEQRLRLLEDKFTVMTREFNETLGEIQTAVEGITKGNKMAFDVAFEKLRNLEEQLKKATPPTDTAVPVDSDRSEGKEL